MAIMTLETQNGQNTRDSERKKTMAKEKTKQKTKRKNSYRKRFTLPNGKRVELTVHTQAECNSVPLNINKLISSKKTGIESIDTTEWALKLPRDSYVRDALIRWKLIEDTSDSEKTLEDLYDVFVVKGKGADNTIKNRKQAFRKLFLFFGSDYRLKDVDRTQAEEILYFLESEGNVRTGEGLQDNSITTHLKRFKMYFRYALDMGWINENPFARFKASYKPTDKWLYVDQKDVMHVIDSIQNRSHKVLIALLRFCGLRGASELSRLTFDESCFHPSTAERPAELIIHSTKVEQHAGLETRPVFLTPYVEKLILDLWEHAPMGENKFFPQMKKESNPGVIVKKLFDRFGVPIAVMYNLRKSFCTDLMAGGLHEADPAMFQRLAGHSLRTSLQCYQIMTAQRKEKAAQKFLEIMAPDGEETRPPFRPLLLPKTAPGRLPQTSANTDENNGLSLENVSFCENQSTVGKRLLEANISLTGVEPIIFASGGRRHIH